MKFYSATGKALPETGLAGEYKQARAIGVVRVGASHLFFRAGLRTYALPFEEIRRCYRRVMRVPLRMCCGKGNLDVEHLVVEGDGGELAQIQLPGTRAAQALMELLKSKLPGADFNPPVKAKEAAQ